MGLLSYILKFLREPSLEGIPLDSAARLSSHQAVLARKKMLMEVFREFHKLFDEQDKRWFDAEGLRVELGSGVAPMKLSYPDVMATDILPAPGLDHVLDAQQMDLADGSVRVIFAQNCFHHFPDPDAFFGELERVLAPGGGAVLLEPYYGPLAGFMYRRLFTSESFEPESPDWKTPVDGPMSGANQALSYMVFVPDRQVFEERYPRLQIVHETVCDNYLHYVLSGGLNFRSLVPGWSMPLVRLLERSLRPWGSLLALHHVVILKKQALDAPE